MSSQESRPKTGCCAASKTSLYVGILCLCAFGVLTGLQWFDRQNAIADEKQAVRNAPPATPKTVSEATNVAKLDGDWPQWRGPKRDGVSTETRILTTWPPTGPRKIWEQPTGKGFSSLAIAYGCVYTMLQDQNGEAVVCWDADDGKELWRYVYAASYGNPYGDGPRATPTVDGEYVYTVGATGILNCLKSNPAKSSGELVWSKDLLKEFNAPNLVWGVSFSPLVDSDNLYINPGGPNGNSVAALDKRTGAVRWKSLDDPGGYSSPQLATLTGERQVVYFGGKALFGVNPQSGALLWRFPWPTSFDCNIATPIIKDDYIYISSGYNQGCALLKIEKTGAELKATAVYENKKMCNHFSSSVLVGDSIYGFNDTTLTCMDFATGKVKWTARSFKDDDLLFGKGSILAVDGQLIILGETGVLGTAEASPEGYRENCHFVCSTEQCWTVPVLAGGRLYVRNQVKLVCYDLRAEGK